MALWFDFHCKHTQKPLFLAIFHCKHTQNPFFWPEIHFWGYFYVFNVKNAFFTPKLLEIPITIEKMTPNPFWVKMTQKWPSDPHFGGSHDPPGGGVFGGQKWVKNDHFWVIFHDFFQKKPLDFPITFFQKKNPWISLLLFFKKMAKNDHFLVILSLGNPHFTVTGKKNHWIW
jgi:hypothetical protein